MLGYIVIILTSIFCCLLINTATVVAFLLTFAIGLGAIKIFSPKDQIGEQMNVYTTFMAFGFCYIVLCYLYMQSHNYDHLIAFDIGNAFMPNLLSILSSSDSFADAVKYIWTDYFFMSRIFPGYFTFQIFFGYYYSLFGADLYIAFQLATLLTGGLSCVLIYNIIKLTALKSSNSSRYTLFICLCSPIFMYSTIFLRDAHITLLYLICIYHFLKEFSIYRVLMIFLLSIVCMTFRVESGIFLMLLTCAYIFVNYKGNRKNLWFNISVMLFAAILLYFVVVNINSIISVYGDNTDSYSSEEISEGSGIIATLQSIPIIGKFLSIFYNAVQPLPFCTSLMVRPETISRPESYNIMKFPIIISTIINWFSVTMVVVYLLMSNLRTKVWRSISTKYKYLMWIGLVFLLMQSHVISQRRLIGFYCVFYIFALIIFEHINKSSRRYVLSISFILYILINTILSLRLLL